MSDEPKGTAEKTIGAVTELAKAVPVYPDLVQPAAKELGQSLLTVAKAVNLALLPLQGMVWGAEKLREFLNTRVSEKLREVPPERIQAPPLHVAGPALQALTFVGNEEHLREMYASLLATSMDAATKGNAHPAFVDIIKNLSPDEARLLNLFNESYEPVNLSAPWNEQLTVEEFQRRAFGLDHPELLEVCLGNLTRLGLILDDEQLFVEPSMSSFYGRGLYSFPERSRVERSGETNNEMTLTAFGQEFCRACVFPIPKSGSR